jgi:hypothetical protein
VIQSGVLDWNVISSDNIHPNDLGHLIIATLLYKHIRSCFLNLNDDAGSFTKPFFLVTDLYEYASALKTTDNTGIQITNNSGWDLIQKESNRLSCISYHANDVLEFKTTWREITFLYLISPATDGFLEISLDGTVVDTLSNNFQGGPWELMLKENVFINPSIVNHDVKLRNLTDTRFLINYVLYAK